MASPDASKMPPDLSDVAPERRETSPLAPAVENPLSIRVVPEENVETPLAVEKDADPERPLETPSLLRIETSLPSDPAIIAEPPLLPEPASIEMSPPPPTTELPVRIFTAPAFIETEPD